MSQYIAGMRPGQAFKASSRRAYESVWRSYLVFLAEQGVDAATADPSHVLDYLKRYRSGTSLRYARLLERVYAKQVGEGVVCQSPFARLQAVLAQEERRPQSPALNISRIDDLIATLPQTTRWQEHRDQAIVVLAVSAGLRMRELRELETYQFVPTPKGLEVQPRGRTVRTREVLLDPAAAEFVEQWLKVRRGLILAQHSQLAFPGRNGRALPVNTLYRRVRRQLQELFGEDVLPSFGIGVLRASFAHQYQRKDAVVEAQYALGHRRITSTLRFFKQLQPINSKTEE